MEFYPTDRATFVEQPEERYQCVECGYILLPPVIQIATCGHRLCSQCFQHLFERQDIAHCPGHDVECGAFQQTQTIQDKATDKELAELKVYCPFKHQGCEHKIKWKTIDFHLRNCLFNPENGGEFNLRPHVKRLHTKYQALRDESKTKFDQINTLDTRLTSVRQRSENLRENVNVNSSKLNSLQGNVISSNEDLHLLQQQLDLKSKQLSFLEERVKNSGEEIRELQSESDVKSIKITALQGEVTLLKSESEKVPTLQRELDRKSTKLAAVENLVISENKRTAENMRTLSIALQTKSKQISTLETQLSRLNKRTVEAVYTLKDETITKSRQIASLERKMTSMNNKYDEQVATLKLELQDKSVKIVSLEKQMMQTNKKYEELEIKLDERSKGIVTLVRNLFKSTQKADKQDIFQSKGDNGTWVWRYPNYFQRKANAMTIPSRIFSIPSKPFYTSHPGYKMRVEIYPVGDGSADGTYISVFFVIMKGEYDSLLDWPFRKTITFSMMDQRGKNQVTKICEPVSDNSSFRRPHSDMNKPYGFKRFIEHRIVEKSSYLKNNTLLFHIQVEN